MILIIITQDQLINEIANREDIDVATVRKIFKSTEKIITAYLSSTIPTDNTIIKILNGLSLECNFVPEKEINTFDKIKCQSRIWTKAKISRYFNKKLNGFVE